MSIFTIYELYQIQENHTEFIFLHTIIVNWNVNNEMFQWSFNRKLHFLLKLIEKVNLNRADIMLLWS